MLRSVQPPDRLLIIDDDSELCALLAEYLGPAGFEVHAEGDPVAGVACALREPFAAIVLDVMLPGIDGIEVLRRIRAHSRVPVLMLTARGDEADRITGLELGADDYLPKPFNPRELIARIRAILRRTRGATASPVGRAQVMVAEDIRLDPAAREAWCGGAPLALTGAEFELLKALMVAVGSVVCRGDLARLVLGRALVPDDRSLDMHASNLRRKLGRHASGGERIRAVRGRGYMLLLPPADPRAGREPEGGE